MATCRPYRLECVEGTVITGPASRSVNPPRGRNPHTLSTRPRPVKAPHPSNQDSAGRRAGPTMHSHFAVPVSKPVVPASRRFGVTTVNTGHGQQHTHHPTP